MDFCCLEGIKRKIDTLPALIRREQQIVAIYKKSIHAILIGFSQKFQKIKFGVKIDWKSWFELKINLKCKERQTENFASTCLTYYIKDSIFVFS